VSYGASKPSAAWASLAGPTCRHVPMDDDDDAVRSRVFIRSKEMHKSIK
jgi:hypothetical protein